MSAPKPSSPVKKPMSARKPSSPVKRPAVEKPSSPVKRSAVSKHSSPVKKPVQVVEKPKKRDVKVDRKQSEKI